MRKESVIASMVIGAVVASPILLRSCTTVPAGHVTVLDTFGSVNPNELDPGLHMANPLSKRIEMETRTKEVKETLKVPTKEGLMAGLDVSILYKIDPTKADEIYKDLGINYSEVVLIPTLRNVVRDVVANYGSDDLYSVNRAKIALDMASELTEQYQQRGIILENVLLRDVSLPNEVTAAIDRKISAKQAAEQMQYVLDKERQESDRKRIEAEGIADAQKIIAEGLTSEYLQWRYITTLESLANSTNNTIVITPYDQKLIPLISVQEKK